MSGLSGQMRVELGNGTYAAAVALVDQSGVPAGASAGTGGGNYAYSYTYNGAGDIATETRTAGGVTESRTYTYDGAANLTGIGAWA